MDIFCLTCVSWGLAARYVGSSELGVGDIGGESHQENRVVFESRQYIISPLFKKVATLVDRLKRVGDSRAVACTRQRAQAHVALTPALPDLGS